MVPGGNGRIIQSTVNDYNRLEEDKANATLIAAAPDSLMAAKTPFYFKWNC